MYNLEMVQEKVTVQMYILVGERPDERVGDHLDDGLGGEHDTHLHVLLRQLLAEGHI